MLVLTRKVGQKLVINGNITITIDRVQGSRVKVGIETPPGYSVVRGELLDDGDDGTELPPDE